MKTIVKIAIVNFLKVNPPSYKIQDKTTIERKTVIIVSAARSETTSIALILITLK